MVWGTHVSHHLLSLITHKPPTANHQPPHGSDAQPHQGCAGELAAPEGCVWHVVCGDPQPCLRAPVVRWRVRFKLFRVWPEFKLGANWGRGMRGWGVQ